MSSTQENEAPTELQLEFMKHQDEMQLRLRQLELDERKFERENGKSITARTQFFVGTVATIIVGIGAAFVTGQAALRTSATEAQNALLLQQENAKLQQELQARQQRFDFIRQATQGVGKTEASETLSFLLQTGILEDPNGEIAKALREGATPDWGGGSRCNNFTTSQRGKALVMEYTVLDLKARLRNGSRVIGYNHAGSASSVTLADGTSINLSRGEITRREAEALLIHDLAIAEEAVRENVRPRITQAQFDVLVSVIASIGIEAFERSEVLRLVNNGRISQVPSALRRLVHRNDQVSQKERNRREDEITLWNSLPE